MEKYPDTFGELLLTGVLHSRDSEIRGAIVWISKTNVIIKRSINKLFPLKKYIKNQPNGYDKGTKVKARNSCNCWTKGKIWLLTLWTLGEGV